MNSLIQLNMPPLILTLKLDSDSFDYFDDLRRRHFPRERNVLSAHVTLFHALPGEHEATIQQTLQELCVRTSMMPLNFPSLRFLGKGVAVEIDCPALIRLRAELSATWRDWLGAQDRQSLRPHITIQNKVQPDEARRLYEQLGADWQPRIGRGEGLQLWRYIGGPWQAAGEFEFASKS